MAYVTKLFNHNFLEYASYVIKDRAIPDLQDGLKPVQRRIIHSLFEMDDGKFHKVANVVGHCMKYHPHGDASIYSALVVLANKELFIDRQGNFGNIYTGDPASAARYIECRLLPLAKRVLYNPAITDFIDSYDGRNREPIVFPAKIPVLLIHGSEGIAVGMATKILPHNYREVLEALKSALKGEGFQLLPDFPTGGVLDATDYQDGHGKVRIRAKLDTSDEKKIVIREIPYGTTTENMIASIENAAKKGKIKVSAINDFTAEDVEIEVKLARGAYTREVEDALYAFTDCETSVSVNLLVISDNRPVVMTVTEVILFYARQLKDVLKAELENERGNLLDKLHARTLERIFVEERIYKTIEDKKSQKGVYGAVYKGFEPFKKEIKREITDEDIERLLKIPIRRISLYDINKARDEIRQIEERLDRIAYHLKNLVEYAVGFIETLIEETAAAFSRRSELVSFDKVDVREVAQRNLSLSYDKETGYLGYGVRTGKVLFDVSHYDRILVIRKSGVYSVIDVPEKLFVDKGMLFCCLADKEELVKHTFSILYKNKESGSHHLKRCKIEKYILEKSYELVPEGCTILHLTDREDVQVVLKYHPKPRLKILEEDFPVQDYLVKGLKAAGVRLTTKAVKSAKVTRIRKKKG